MTDLVQSVRLKFDGTGVVGEVNKTTQAVDNLADAARKVAPASAGIAATAQQATSTRSAIDGATSSVGELTSAINRVGFASERLKAIRAALVGAGEGSAELVDKLDSVDQQLSIAARRGTAAGVAIGTGLSSAAGEIDELRRTVAGLTSQLDVAESALNRSKGATTAHAAASGNMAIAAAETEHAVRAFADSVNAGQSPLRAFTLELPRLTQAAGFMGGALGTVGEFLSGPWGIALTIGVSVLGPLISALLDTEDAAEKGKKAVADITDAIKAMGDGIDQQTGKLEAFNKQLSLSARLQAAATRPELQSAIEDQTKGIVAAAQSAQTKAGAKTIGGTLTFGLAGNVSANATAYEEIGQALAASNGNAQALVANITRLAATDPALRPLAKTLADQNVALSTNVAKLGELNAAEARYDVVAQGGTVQTRQTIEAEIARRTATDASARATANLAVARAALTKAEQDYDRLGPTKGASAALDAAKDQVVAAQKLADAARAQKRTDARERKPADTSGLVNSVENDIRSINAAFDDTPTFVERARTAIAKLDQDAAALEKKRPPNYRSLIDQIGETRTLIEDNLDKPFDDFIRSQEQSIQVSTLLARGHDAEAEALLAVFTLQREMGPLTDVQKASVLETVQALRAEQEAQAKLAASRQQDLQALDQIRTAITGVLSGSSSLRQLPRDLLKSFQQLNGEQLFDKLFDGAFSKLKDQVNGTDKVSSASQTFVDALGTTDQPIKTFGSALDALSTKISGIGVVGGSTSLSSGIDDGAFAAKFGGLADIGHVALDASKLNASLGLDTVGSSSDDNAIVVTARKQAAATDQFMTAVQLFNKAGGSIGASLDKLLGTHGVLGQLGGKLGDALKGAGIGSVVGSTLGLDGTGSALGGALGKLGGSALAKSGITDILGPGLQKALGGALPVVGSIIGSVAGGLLGSLFAKVKKSSATIDFSAGSASIGTVTGTSAGRKKTASGEASGVIDSLDSVADQLGGILSGLGSVSIGTRNKSFVVDTTGKGRTKGAGVEKFGSAQEAQAAALADAIADGAIGGISAAMQKALASSTDVSKGVAEALKVRDVQDVLTGLGTDLLGAFRTFGQQAADRVRIAKDYGFDVVQIEKYNADQRKALIDTTLKQSVGSLQDLLDNLATGDLSEGDAVTKRNALLDKITAARVDANAGKDGAADTLSTLLQNLISSDRENFGTAGPQLSADRALAQSAAEEAIKAESDRITAAQSAVATTNASLATANKLADENNSQNAQVISKLDQLLAAVTKNTGGGSGLDLSLVSWKSTL